MSYIEALQFLGVFAAILIGACVIYLAIKSPIEPFAIFIRAWKISGGYFRIDARLMLQITTAFAIGWAMQEFFQYYPIFSDANLIIGSIFWQGLLAVFLALCAGKFHLSIIGKLASAVVDLEFRPPQFRQIALKVALCGGIVWLLGYGFKVLSNVAILQSPLQFISASAIATAVMTQVLLAPLALIRPAMAFGEKQPIRSSLRLAVRHLFPLLVVVVLVVIPPVLIGLGMLSIRALLGPNLALNIFLGGCFLIFSVFQFFAYEAATLIVFRNANWPDRDIFD